MHIKWQPSPRQQRSSETSWLLQPKRYVNWFQRGPLQHTGSGKEHVKQAVKSILVLQAIHFLTAVTLWCLQADVWKENSSYFLRFYKSKKKIMQTEQT